MEKPSIQAKSTPYTLVHILVIFALLAVLIVSNLYIMIPLLGNVAETYLITPVEAGLSISVFSFFYAFGLIFFGPLSERFGLKETICSGLFVLIILMVVSFFTTNFMGFLIVRGLQGFFAASFAPVSFIYVLNVLSTRHRGIAIGVINTGFLSAGVIGQLLSSSINLIFTWKWIFLTLAFFYFLLLIYSIKQLPHPKKSDQFRSISSLIKLLVKLPLRSDLKRLYFITFTTLLAFVAYYTSLESLFQHTLSLSPQATLSVRAFGLIGLLLTIYSGKIASKIGFENTIILGLLLKLAGLTLSSITNIFFIGIGAIIFVGGISIIIPSLIQLIGEKGGKIRSLTISLYSFILLLGASFGSAISLFSNYYLQLFSLTILLICSLLVTILEKKE
ncbi:MFS transporter [Anaerobacillus isosaccharinicus]|uniref:MFS transporter n=1 Tax=Anaerobacillus isosaccharinicus TaxID=1532552 RepID=A0A1S2MFR5_9BACI|nr:MFS transporter [Anaerobacillus isosaccharinicus]MBA5588844.1 MFS transporter [Anaerobacillus isosaccharinicus]QOY37767.1 MFS transporter [Anaerobacillus isosaccharinicus]